MSSNDDIEDALTRHQIFVLRYARGREREAEDYVAKTLQTVIERLEDEELTDVNRARMQQQARDLYEYLLASNSEYSDDFIRELTEFAGYEAQLNARVGSNNIDVGFNVPAPTQLQQAIFADILEIEPTKGYSLRGMLEEYGRQNATLVVDQIRESVILGETTQQLTTKIRDLIPTQKRKAATVARTAVNHVATQARKETMKENTDVLDGYEWIATLDGRTSLICMSRDGVIYKDFDNDPMPPAHFNCRSTITFLVDKKYDLGADIVGERPSVGSSGAKRVRGDLTYDKWLRRQSKSFQNRVLGKSRAKLFRGGMSIDRFVDDRGAVLTLAELADNDAQFTNQPR